MANTGNSNNGVSFPIVVDGTKCHEAPISGVKKYSLQQVNPPKLEKNGNKVSQSLLKWVNPYPQISFQKIILPYFDGVYKNTSQISNQPDFITDYHFISLMRCIDFYNKDVYSAQINVSHDTPKPASN